MSNYQAPVAPIRAARMCPVCGESSRVYRTKELEDGAIRRERKCVACGYRFLTVESLIAVDQGVEQVQIRKRLRI